MPRQGKSTLASRLRGSFSRLLAPAEDPRQLFQSPGDRQEQLKVKLAQALHDLELASSQLLSKSAEVELKLAGAVEQEGQLKENEQFDLAKLVGRQIQFARVELDAFEKQLHRVREDHQRLLLIQRQLTSYMEACNARHAYLSAQASAFETKVEISESLVGLSEELGRLQEMMEEAERESDLMQARAAAIDRLTQEGVLNSPLGISTTLDAELNALYQDLVNT